MTPTNPLLNPGRTSPQFYKQLIDLLHGNEYQGGGPSLQSDDLVRLVGFPDSVNSQSVSPYSTINADTGSRQYFQSYKCSISGIAGRTRRVRGVRKVLPESFAFSDSVPGHLLPARFWMWCMRRPSMIRTYGLGA